MTAPEIIVKKSDEPILIVDREGLIGEKLAARVKDEAPTVLVSEKAPKHEDVIHIAYEKKFPQIPDNTYSHIFVIDDGSPVTRESLASFLEKAQNDNSFFLFATSYKEINEKLIEDLTGYYQKARILFFGDVFGADRAVGEAKASFVNKFIAQARLKNKILVPGEGTTVSYPVFFEDLIDSLLEVMFGQGDDRVFYAFPKYPPTLLSLARMIQKSNPHVSLDFTKDKAGEALEIPPRGKYVLGESYNLETRIKKLEINEKPYIERDEELEEEVKEEKKGRFVPKLLLFGVFTLLLLPILSTLLFSFLGGVSAKGLEFYIGRGDLEKAEKSSLFAKTYYGLGEKTASLIPFMDTTAFSKSYNTASGANAVINGFKALDFAQVKNGLALLQREKTDFPMLPFATSTVSVWEELLGFKETRKYLLLLQDKNEIRPTGGIIESYATVTLDKGKIVISDLVDAGEPDTKQKGVVEPPFPIRRYLDSDNLSFKDTNFNIDFPQSASSSAVLLSVLTEEKVDGVIALDKALFIKIEEELEKENKSYMNLLETVERAIERKEILFAFNDVNLQKIFIVNGWSSSLLDLRKGGDNKALDFLGVVESNLGKNKINGSVKRTVSQNVNLSEEGAMSVNLTITYKNDSKEGYKNYLRVILPGGSKISQVRVNDRARETISAIKNPDIYEDSDFEVPEELELDRIDQSGKSIYGLFFEIGPQATEEITLTYIHPSELDLSSHVAYDLKIFKQPYLDSLYKFSITFPESFKLTKGAAKFEKELSGDENILIDLSKI